jgi:hypothetical protein
MAGEHEDHLGAAGTEQPRPEQRPGRVADSQMGAVPGGPGVVDDPSRGVRHRGLGGGIPGVRLAAQRDSRDPRPAGRVGVGVGGAALAMWIALVAAAACLAAWSS